MNQILDLQKTLAINFKYRNAQKNLMILVLSFPVVPLSSGNTDKGMVSVAPLPDFTAYAKYLPTQ